MRGSHSRMGEGVKPSGNPGEGIGTRKQEPIAQARPVGLTTGIALEVRPPGVDNGGAICGVMDESGT